jgi:hypothetical protein
MWACHLAATSITDAATVLLDWGVQCRVHDELARPFFVES